MRETKILLGDATHPYHPQLHTALLLLLLRNKSTTTQSRLENADLGVCTIAQFALRFEAFFKLRI